AVGCDFLWSVEHRDGRCFRLLMKPPARSGGVCLYAMFSVNYSSFLIVHVTPVMVYRRTEKVVRRLAQRHAAIIAAARATAAEAGMAAVQIAPVAERAGIAAGTVYRYFPSKTDPVAAVGAAGARTGNDPIRPAAHTRP